MQAYFYFDGDKKLAISLVDLRHGPSQADIEMADYLEQVGIPYWVVATKADKLSKTAVVENLKELEEIYARHDIIPVIAHIDRYVGFLRTRGIMERLAQLPVLVQANASFFINKRTSRLALSLLAKNKIHLLGSDCHNSDSRRPNLGEAYEIIRNKLGESALQKITANENVVFSQNNNAVKELFI
jgi:tyrosine-protein phosphatase YwqE